MPGRDTRRFANQHEAAPITVAPDTLRLLNSRKEKLLSMRLLGTLETGPWAGYDYGNLSLRLSREPLELLMSGKQTSCRFPASADDFALVHGYRPADFTVLSRGPIEPSSETPLHWAACEADPAVGAVVHGHIVEDHPLAPVFLEYLRERRPASTELKSKSREGAEEIGRIVRQRGPGVILMPRHDGGFGVFSTGASLDEAVEGVLRFHEDLESFARARLP
ncbi:MAG: class II aldolase/adducin family protein [Elusimicrobia bacterium]|nr:class II aldolase/adducin family protein [Elusimicrobiota bacterium]